MSLNPPESSPADIPLPLSPLTTPPSSPLSHQAQIMPAPPPAVPAPHHLHKAVSHQPGFYASKSFPPQHANAMWEAELTADEEFYSDIDAVDAIEHTVASMKMMSHLSMKPFKDQTQTNGIQPWVKKLPQLRGWALGSSSILLLVPILLTPTLSSRSNMMKMAISRVTKPSLSQTDDDNVKGLTLMKLSQPSQNFHLSKLFSSMLHPKDEKSTKSTSRTHTSMPNSRKPYICVLCLVTSSLVRKERSVNY